MAIARQTDDTLVKPLTGCIVRRRVVGATVEAAQPVYLDSNGKVQPADATAVAKNYPYGVCVQDGAAGDTIDIVVYGPMVMVTGATPGKIIYTSDTAGEVGETAGTKTSIVGVAESATVVLVRPAIVSLA